VRTRAAGWLAEDFFSSQVVFCCLFRISNIAYPNGDSPPSHANPTHAGCSRPAVDADRAGAGRLVGPDRQALRAAGLSVSERGEACRLVSDPVGGRQDPDHLCAPGLAKGRPRMDRSLSPSEAVDRRDLGSEPGADSGPRGGPSAPGGKVLAVGRAVAQTVRHFWPGFSPLVAAVARQPIPAIRRVPGPVPGVVGAAVVLDEAGPVASVGL